MATPTIPNCDICGGSCENGYERREWQADFVTGYRDEQIVCTERCASNGSCACCGEEQCECSRMCDHPGHYCTAHCSVCRDLLADDRDGVDILDLSKFKMEDCPF